MSSPSLQVLRLLPELDFGGVESRLQVQARLHDREEYSLRVCCFHKAGRAAEALRDLGVQVDVLEVNPSPRNPRATLALARYLRRVRPHVVHASIAEANLHSLLAKPLSGGRVFIAEETGMPSHSRVARLTYRAAYSGADAIVGVTEAVCDYVRNVDRAPAERVRLIYNCAGPVFFPEARCEPRAAAAPLTILLVGRLVPVKNQSFFLRVLKRVVAEHTSQARVLIAGDGPLKEELRAEIHALGLESVVSLLGVQTDVRALLRQADVFALPSLSEGCSISLIEAMASGVQVIGSSVPGIQEVMGALGKDWTAPPNDEAAWSALLHQTLSLSSNSRQQLALQAQERAYESFSPRAYVRRLAQMYADLTRSAHRA